MTSIIKKELNSFLSSLSGYMVILVFLILNGLFLWIFPGSFNLLDDGADNDQDGICDIAYDFDIDNDLCTNDMDLNPFVFAPDTDGDEIGDHCDKWPFDVNNDSDFDGLPECTVGASFCLNLIANNEKLDIYPGDPLNDGDEDGLGAKQDNCQFIHNPNQEDQDEDTYVDPRYAEQDEDPADHILPPKKKRILKVKFQKWQRGFSQALDEISEPLLEE